MLVRGCLLTQIKKALYGLSAPHLMVHANKFSLSAFSYVSNTICNEVALQIIIYCTVLYTVLYWTKWIWITLLHPLDFFNSNLAIWQAMHSSFFSHLIYSTLLVIYRNIWLGLLFLFFISTKIRLYIVFIHSSSLFRCFAKKATVIFWYYLFIYYYSFY